MFNIFRTEFEPHGFCIKWSTELLSMYIISDILIFCAYTFIGISLILFAKTHKTLAWVPLLWLFATFILACGLSHLMDIVTFWLPVYAIDAILKCITAIVSVSTVAYLAPRLSMLLHIHSHEEFEVINKEKEHSNNKLLIEKYERRNSDELKQTYLEHHYAIDKAAIFVITDSNGTITFANDLFCKISGYSRDEIIGSSHKMFKSGEHPPEFYKNLWSTISAGKVWHDEMCNRHKDGSLYWVDTVIVPIIDTTDTSSNKPKKYITIRFDITDRRKTERIQLELTKQLNQMQKVESLSRLTAGIAHDFNNILNCILGYNELNIFVADDCVDEKLKEDLTVNATEIEKASKRASRLIKKMLTYSRQRPINIDAEIRPSMEVINDVASMVGPALTSKYQLILDIDDYIDIQIDSTDLHQILTNLIVNARDAMKQGGKITVSLKQLPVRKRICTSCSNHMPGQEYIELSVSDDGTGIDTEVLNHIFDPFFTTKPVGEGTGLGLSTVSGMVHEVGGHIIVDSNTQQPSCGTTFRLLFPV